MITKLGENFTDFFRRNMPDAFVFALILTILTALTALFWIGSSPLEIIKSWYQGFWTLLEFGMQMVLLIITGYSIALSPIVKKGIDQLATIIRTPKQVYFFVVLVGVLMTMVSWGWLVITAFLGRELATRVKGINYPYLVACAYFSHIAWVTGMSSSIPLLLNTPKNYLIEADIVPEVIATSFTLGSTLNLSMMVLCLLLCPIIMLFLIPKTEVNMELGNYLQSDENTGTIDIKEEAEGLEFKKPVLSDQLNNSIILQYIIALAGISYIVYHFTTHGLDLNLNIMIFLFLMLGLLLHKTPMRYSISMKRASGNVSGILFQFPFYAGIMGIMTFTGLGQELGELMASMATINTYPLYAYLLGGIVNFAIPSGGGEFAVVGPSVIEAVNTIGANLPLEESKEMVARAALALAYGEGLTNLLQPFYLLLVLPVMGAGTNIQARDVMGYLVIPFLVFFILQIAMVMWLPL